MFAPRLLSLSHTLIRRGGNHNRRHGCWCRAYFLVLASEYDPFSEACRELPTCFSADWLAAFRFSVGRHPLLDA